MKGWVEVREGWNERYGGRKGMDKWKERRM
jgi:hypothetical protein